MAVIKGTKKRDTLRGTSGADEIYGYGGNDTINPGFGADRIDGGAGNDTIVFTGTSSASGTATGRIIGGTGNDTIDLRAITAFDVSMADNVVYVTVGRQRFAIESVETIRFGNSNDFVTPDLQYSGSRVALRGGGGNDYLSGGGNYALYGEAGDDKVVIAGSVFDTTKGVADGGTGFDTLVLIGEFDVDLAAGTASSRKGSYSVAGFEAVETINLSTVRGSDLAEKLSVNANQDDGDGAQFYGRGGADTLTGGLGMDLLDGGAGADVLTGGRGADTLTGGADGDRFVFRAGDSTATDTDVIVDFGKGDRIDLSAIDANTIQGGVNAFTFIGKAAFTRTAGELRYTQIGRIALVEGDVNGDGRADVSIQLEGRHKLTAASFVLSTGGLPFADADLVPHTDMPALI